MNYRRILVEIDENNPSNEVADHAMAIAKNCNSEFHIITVFDVPDIYSSNINPDKLSHQNIKERVEKMEQRLLEIKKSMLKEKAYL